MYDHKRLKTAYEKLSVESRMTVTMVFGKIDPDQLAKWMHSAGVDGFRASTVRSWLSPDKQVLLDREQLKPGRVQQFRKTLGSFCMCSEEVLNALAKGVEQAAAASEEPDPDDLISRILAELELSEFHDIFAILLPDVIGDLIDVSEVTEGDKPSSKEGEQTAHEDETGDIDALVVRLQNSADLCTEVIGRVKGSSETCEDLEELLSQLHEDHETLVSAIAETAADLGIPTPESSSPEALREIPLTFQEKRLEISSNVLTQAVHLAEHLQQIKIAHRSPKTSERIESLAGRAAKELKELPPSIILQIVSPGDTGESWLGRMLRLEGEELDVRADQLAKFAPALSQFICECDPAWVRGYSGEESDTKAAVDEASSVIAPVAEERIVPVAQAQSDETGASPEAEEEAATSGSTIDSAGSPSNEPESTNTSSSDYPETVEDPLEDGEPASGQTAPERDPGLSADRESPCPAIVPDGGSSRLLGYLISLCDFSAAYWVARSLADEGELADSSLCAVLAAAHASHNSIAEEFAGEIFQMISENAPQERDSELIALSAALPGALEAPSCGFTAWLDFGSLPSSLRSVASAIRDYATTSMAYPSDASARPPEGSPPSSDSVAMEAETWLAAARLRKMKAVRATRVWLSLVGEQGDLGRLVHAMRTGNTSEVQELRSGLAKRDQVIHRIEGLYSGRGRKSQLQSSPREQLVRGVGEAIAYSDRWLRSEKLVGESQSQDWVLGKATVLHDSLSTSLTVAIKSVGGDIAKSTERDETGVSACLLRSLIHVGRIVGITCDEIPTTDPILRNVFDESPSLADELSQRLAWVPEVAIDSHLRPQPTSVPMLRHLIAAAVEKESRSPGVVVMEAIQNRDLRFVSELIETVDDDTEREELGRKVGSEQEGLRHAIDAQASECRALIEKAVIDGALDEESHTRFQERVESAARSESRDFRSLQSDLTGVSLEVGELRERGREGLRKRWKAIKSGLAPQAQGTVDSYESTIEEALERGDARVAEELLSQADDAKIKGAPLPTSPGTEEDPLADYLAAVGGITKWLREKKGVRKIPGTLSEGNMIGGLDHFTPSSTRIDEVRKATRSWHELRSKKGRDQRVGANAIQILEFLGMSALERSDSIVAVRSKAQDVVHLVVKMSASTLSRPISEFGSRCEGNFNVICLWEKPGADSIGARLHDLGLQATSVIVVYLDSLSPTDRVNMYRRTAGVGLQVALLDESLFAFLCLMNDARYPSFIRTALPFTTVNPYTPFAAGVIPPEMFFGRQEHVRALLNEDACLVYGGRQLGKSALLRYVAGEFLRPEMGQFSHFADIKRIGSDEHSPQAFWPILRDAAKEAGILSQKITSVNPETLRSHLVKALNPETGKKFLLFLDEADNFLESDAEGGFTVVDSLRGMMVETERHFRVVFAGLHGVQRYEGIKNQPLAHFGTLRVGPLEPRAARALVVEPLHAVGVRFADEATVLSILSYTNYHPGLIQLFCQECLKRLSTRRQRLFPPIELREDDVDGVYLAVRDQIRERLEWTLALDPRYQAIAWSLILEQIESEEGFTEAYTPRSALELVRGFWPKGFEAVSELESRSLLEEMSGLGVLVKDIDSRYRLKSPNLVNLIGDKDEILGRLASLSDQEPAPPFRADSYHASLGVKGQLYSPFSMAQERALYRRTSGYCLIVGSDALGCGSVKSALEAINQKASAVDGGSCLVELPDSALQERKVAQWLEDFHRNNDSEQTIAYCRFVGDSEQQLAACRDVHEFSRRRAGKQVRWVRVFFLLYPESYLHWLSADPDERQDAEDRADSVVKLRPWDSAGVRHHLIQNGMIDTPQVISAIGECTGGWMHLLQDVMKASSTDDPRESAEELYKQLRPDGGTVAGDFRKSLDLNRLDDMRTILKAVIDSGEVLAEMLAPDLLKSELGVDSDGSERIVEALIGLSYLTETEGVITPDPIIARTLE
jgi:hypothetical protein